ncbi:MAG: heavy metal-associated domain-containing protein [Bacilli bacterium]
MKKIIVINNMKCEHCTSKVEGSLNALEGVKSAKVNLAKKEAIIHGDVEDSVLEEAVNKAGYEVVSIYEKKGLF